jgi:hypothetical protein
MRARMQSNATGRRLLRERPRVTCSRISVDGLRRLPKESFGYAYAQVSPSLHDPRPFLTPSRSFWICTGLRLIGRRYCAARVWRVTCDV